MQRHFCNMFYAHFFNDIYVNGLFYEVWWHCTLAYPLLHWCAVSESHSTGCWFVDQVPCQQPLKAAEDDPGCWVPVNIWKTTESLAPDYGLLQTDWCYLQSKSVQRR